MRKMDLLFLYLGMVLGVCIVVFTINYFYGYWQEGRRIDRYLADNGIEVVFPGDIPEDDE